MWWGRSACAEVRDGRRGRSTCAEVRDVWRGRSTCAEARDVWWGRSACVEVRDVWSFNFSFPGGGNPPFPFEFDVGGPGFEFVVGWQPQMLCVPGRQHS